jgi:hypothetical protein
MKSEVQTPAIMVLKAQSRNFGEFMKLIFTLIPKQDFTLMIGSPIMQIYKNIGGRKSIVSKVKLQLNVIRL